MISNIIFRAINYRVFNQNQVNRSKNVNAPQLMLTPKKSRSSIKPGSRVGRDLNLRHVKSFNKKTWHWPNFDPGISKPTTFIYFINSFWTPREFPWPSNRHCWSWYINFFAPYQPIFPLSTKLKCISGNAGGSTSRWSDDIKSLDILIRSWRRTSCTRTAFLASPAKL